MASLSEKLRRERELRGISLKQISEETKIGVRFLEALEEDALERIPGEFYRRSYLRAYARYLGLDEDRAVNAYLYSRGEGRSEEEPTRSEPRSESSPWLLWVVVLVVLLGASFLFLRSGEGKRGGTTVPAASTEPTSAAAPALSTEGDSGGEVRVPAPEMVPPAAVVDRPESLPVTDPSAPLRLVVAVTEPCWLEIQADGVVVATGLKEEGFRQALSAHDEVRLWLGNAGGVSLWVNERPAKPLGRDGQVRKDLTITPTNLAEFLTDSEDFS